MTYNFNLDCSSENYEIKIDTEAKYGFFEHKGYGDARGGGLWFEFAAYMDKLQLVDADGTSEVPKEVAKALVTNGFIVGWEF